MARATSRQAQAFATTYHVRLSCIFIACGERSHVESLFRESSPFAKTNLSPPSHHTLRIIFMHVAKALAREPTFRQGQAFATISFSLRSFALHVLSKGPPSESLPLAKATFRQKTLLSRQNPNFHIWGFSLSFLVIPPLIMIILYTCII